MKIESIRLKNYKVFRDLHLKDIPSFRVSWWSGTGVNAFAGFSQCGGA